MPPTPIEVPQWSFRQLDRDHDRALFCCGEDALDIFLRQHARQNADKGFSVTYVASPSSEPSRIAGYYSLAVASVVGEKLPPAVGKGLPRYPVPVVLLARLARDNAFKGSGLGEILLLDAFEKARAVADIAGAVAIQVDALHEKAAQFYETYGFKRMADSPNILFLSMKVVRQALARHEPPAPAAPSSGPGKATT